MRRKDGVSWITISLALILVLSSVALTSSSISTEPISALIQLEPERAPLPAGTPHAPIAIDGDANFSATASTEGWPGDGSSEDPFIIDGLEIDRGGRAGSGLNISNTRVNFTVSNCNLTGASTAAGIYLNNVSYGSLINNTCRFNQYGIYLLDSSYNTLTNNTCTSNGNVGIDMYNSDFNMVADNDCDDNANYGIRLYYCDSNIFSRNLCSRSRYEGIQARYADSNIFSDNTCNRNGDNGISVIWYSSGNILVNNTCDNNGGRGIMIDNDDYNFPASVSNNTCNGNVDGIYVSGSFLNVINNTVTDNIWYGFDLSCSDSTITHNTVTRSYVGFYSFGTAYSALSHNNIMETDVGIEIHEGGENMISFNSITKGYLMGIIVQEFSGRNTLFLNDIFVDYDMFLDEWTGIYLDGTSAENNATMNYLQHDFGNVLDPAAIRDNGPGQDNIIDRNWYSDYGGRDNNGDGYGDTPYPIIGTAGNSDPRPLVYLPHGPMWTEPPVNQLLDLWSQPFYYDLNATAPSPLTWAVNDTSQFTVNSIGVVESIVHLPVDVYGLNVSVTNIYGFRIAGVFQLTVREISLPEWIVGPTDLVFSLEEQIDYALIASDESGIADWAINDTSNFNLSATHLNVTGYRFGWHLLHISNLTQLFSGSYSLNVSVSDPYNNSIHGIFTITIEAPPKDTTPPEWVIAPLDETVDYGDPFVQRIGAWDSSGIDHWWLNDTDHFSLDEQGFIRNVTVLEPGVYRLEVRAFDPHDNYCLATLVLTVNEATTSTTTTSTQPPDEMGPTATLLLFTGIGGAVAIVIVIVLLRRKP